MRRWHNLLKTTCWLAMGLSASAPAHADSDLSRDQVPEAVMQRFRQDYPKARSIEYELETENGQRIYEIDFKVGRRKIQVHYREDGTLVRQDSHDSDDDDD